MSGSRPAMAYLMDHRVQGRAILPGAAMFEMAVAAGKVLPVIMRTIFIDLQGKVSMFLLTQVDESEEDHA